MATDGRSDVECKDALYALVLSKPEGYNSIELTEDLWKEPLRVSLSLLARRCGYSDVHDFLCTGMPDVIEPVLSSDDATVIYRARQTPFSTCILAQGTRQDDARNNYVLPDVIGNANLDNAGNGQDDDDPLTALVRRHMQLMSATQSKQPTGGNSLGAGATYLCPGPCGQRIFPGGLIEVRPVVSKNLPEEFAILAAVASENHGGLREEHLAQFQRILWTMQSQSKDQLAEKYRQFLYCERIKTDHETCEPIMKYATVGLLRAVPGSPSSARHRCKIVYPAGYADKDDIVPGVRIRLRPSNVEEALPGVTGIVQSVNTNDRWLLVELLESTLDFNADLYSEESYYVWNSQLRALDDADGRVWALLAPKMREQRDEFGFGFDGYSVPFTDQESKNAYEAERKAFLDQHYSDSTPFQLNGEQQKAVFAIASGKYPEMPFVLHGPPGTGKTDVLYHGVLSALTAPGNSAVRILICTQANGPANELAERILKGDMLSDQHVFRMYSMSQKPELKRSSVLDGATYVGCYMPMETYDIVGDWAMQWQWGLTDSVRRNAQKIRYGLPPLHEIEHHPVVICTLAAATYLISGGIQRGHFTHIIIDEAGQATVPEVLVPLSLTGAKTKVVFCGDHMQRGPVIEQRLLERFGFTTSPLEQVLDCDGYRGPTRDDRLAITLTQSYGCALEIVDLINDSYGNELQSVRATDMALLEHMRLAGSIPIAYPVTFDNVKEYLDASGRRQEAGERKLGNQYSYDNIAEAIKVYKHVRRLMVSGTVLPGDIGVIAFYKNQVTMLRRMLRKYPDIVVESVERYQGSRKRVLIVSTVRTTELGFVAGLKRFNTAVTRAMDVLIVVGCRDALWTPHKPHAENPWTKLIKQCDECGSSWDKCRRAMADVNLEIERQLDEEVRGMIARDQFLTQR
ncbi:putative RNA helicase SDE3-like protein [Aphelenchoides avenae]|nr:putative RNA helicase SDE3-like protein [Aphelenchus avenae]